MSFVSPPPRPAWQRSTVATLLVLAVLVGIGAALLLGSSPHSSPARAGELIIDLPVSAWGLLFLAPLLVGLCAILIQRWLHPPSSRSQRWLALQALILIGLVLASVYVLQALGSSGGGGSIGYVTGPVAPTPTNNSTGGGIGAGGTGGPTQITTLSFPPWALDVAVAVVAGIVAVLALPGVLRRVVDRGRFRTTRPLDPAALAATLASAAAALERGEDPRATIVRLYVQLLPVVAPKVGDLSALTPQEIAARLVEGLGVGRPASQELTRLFEEARYSTHPMGAEEASRCRTALGSVENDLRRGVGAPG
jgi:hypothetical protein